jgi:flagellar hook-associated protein 3 FlgL
MRVSEMSRMNSRARALEQAHERMDNVQQQLSTGRRIEKMSSDPAAAALALRHRQAIDFETQMRRNLSGGSAFLNASESALGGVNDALQRVRELTVQAGTGTISAQDRQAIAQEVSQLIGQIAQLANTNFSGAYVFAGHRSNVPAYVVMGNPPATVTYQGDLGMRTRRISREDASPVNMPGPNVFGTVFNDLITLRDNLAGAVPPATIVASLADIDTALERVINARADLGARANRFDAANSVSEVTNIDLQKLRSEVEEVDITEAVVRFTSAQQALQAATAAIGRTSNMTLLDFLR